MNFLSKDRFDAAFGADVLLVIIEWPEVRRLDPRRFKQARHPSRNCAAWASPVKT